MRVSLQVVPSNNYGTEVDPDPEREAPSAVTIPFTQLYISTILLY